MDVLCCNAAALAMASLFYYWRSYHVTQQQRERLLRERVACLLWAVAEQAD
jgi:hypothetical protein